MIKYNNIHICSYWHPLKNVYKMTTTSSKLITTLEDLQSMVSITKGQIRTGGGKSDQVVTFAQIGTDKDQGKVFHYDKVSFKYMAVECDGPALPHEKKVGTMELGPKRPLVKLILSPGQAEYQFHITLDQMTRAGYEFNRAKLREAFPELLTFTYETTTIAPTRANSQGKTGYEVIVVATNGAMKSLAEYLPAQLNKQQEEAVAQIDKDKRLTEVECIDEDGKKYKTFVFADLEPKIDAKSKKIYTEMNIPHSSFPDNIRHYRSPEHPYRPSMSDINNWGIVINRMVANASGGFNFDPTTDFCKEPGFHAVTKPGERNPFIGRVGFAVECVMEGSGHVKVWYRATVWVMPQKSSAASDDFGEEAIAAPAGNAISLSPQSKAAANGDILTGTATVVDPDTV